jgi:uncharacterized protein YecT (DUF1311 family)
MGAGQHDTRSGERDRLYLAIHRQTTATTSTQVARPSFERIIGRMNTFRFLCIITLAIAGAPFSAFAADAPQTKQYATCMDKTGTTTAGMVDCASAETKRQDARLNIAYKALIADLPPARKTQLQEVQRTWIKFRDANCAFYADPDGGTLALVDGNLCVMTSTTERANEL